MSGGWGGGGCTFPTETTCDFPGGPDPIFLVSRGQYLLLNPHLHFTYDLANLHRLTLGNATSRKISRPCAVSNEPSLEQIAWTSA